MDLLKFLLLMTLAMPAFAYEKTSGISGNLSSIGSDTLANLMTFWTEAFKKHYPSVNIQVQAAGSSTAPPALTEGTANFGPMSRKMKHKEIQAFETRHGYKPFKVRVAIDALAVYVHKDNPITNMSIKTVDSIFSVTRRCGGDPISGWEEIGLTGGWEERKIQLYGQWPGQGEFCRRWLCQTIGRCANRPHLGRAYNRALGRRFDS